MVCIFAGYTEETQKMISMNPGLRDRIQFCIDFPDFNEAELLKLFEKLCKDNKYVLSESAGRVLKEGLSKVLNAKHKNFSNGRFVRKVFERARIKQAIRCNNSTITEADIKAAFAERDISALMKGGSRARIGFN